MTPPPRPTCFVAMPFGTKSPPGGTGPAIDFDTVNSTIREAVEAEGLECVRADFEHAGGFIHRSMFERLIVAEYVVADLTFANPNVLYEVGIRHGTTDRPTILIAEKDSLSRLPFDARPLRVLPYVVSDAGRLAGKAAEDLKGALAIRLREAREGRAPIDNPIMQVTAWVPGGRLEHEKTDVFMERLAYAGEIGERISRAVRTANRGAAIEALSSIRDEVLGDGNVVPQLHTALLGVYLGFRERRAYREMVDLYEDLPEELRRTKVAIEQLALALNRLAEKAVEDGRPEEATELRRRALEVLDEIPESRVTSETDGIRGRIYKAWADAEAEAGDEASSRARLGRAIETYERGFRADLRDYYPGVNVVTLRVLRGTREDFETNESLIPVVRFAVENAPEPRTEEERYWQAATRLEISAAAGEWDRARRRLDDVLGLDVPTWMHDTTIGNLRRLRTGYDRIDDVDAVTALDELIEALE